jgi:hypothetical protein
MWRRSSEALLLCCCVCGVLLVFGLTWRRIFPSGAGKIATLLHYLGKVVIVNRHLFSSLQLEYRPDWGLGSEIEFALVCYFTSTVSNISTVFA